MNSTLALAVADGKTLSQSHLLPSGKEVTYFNAQPGQRFILTDSEKPLGPQRLRVKRVGNNLEVGLPDEDEARLVILDFYSHNAALQGLDEQGNAHDYVNAEDNSEQLSEFDDGEGAFIMMQSESDSSGPLLLPTNDSGMWMAIGAFAGLLGLGGIIRSMQNQHGNDGGLPPPLAPSIDIASDDTGIYTGTLKEGGLTDDARPLLSGHAATPGDIITVYVDGNPLGSATVGADGSWSFTPPVALAHGQHTFTATVTAIDGQVSELSAEFTLNIDLVAPARPLITLVDDVTGMHTGSLTSGDVTDDARPMIKGSAEPGATVAILIDGVKVAEVIAAADGGWSWQPTTPLTDGEYRLTIQATDLAGNIGLPSLPFYFTVDTVPPVQPAIDKVTDSVAGGVEGGANIGNDGLTNDNRPVLSGGAESGSLIQIYDANGNLLASVTVTDEGWSWRPPAALSDGEHGFTITATDVAGNVSAPSSPYVFTVDTVAPVQLTIDAVTDSVIGGIDGGADIGNGGLTNDNRPVLSGSAEIGSLVQIYDEKGTRVGSIVATDGTWSWQPPAALNDGERSFTITATDVAGNVSVPSSPYVFTVDTVAPVQLTIDAVTDSVIGGIEGGADIGNGGLTNDNRPVLSGSTEMGSLVQIYDENGTRVGSVIATDGTWSWQPPAALNDGERSFTITATDVAGNVSAPSSPYVFMVDTVAPVQLTIDAVTDSVIGGIDGGADIGNGGLTNDNRPVLSGSAEVGSLVQIYDENGTRVGSVIATDGTWSWQPPAALNDGERSFTITATDAAGNASAPSSPYVFTVDTVAPVQLTIDAVTDSVIGGIEGGADIGNGGLTNDNRPVLSGSAEVGSLVHIYDESGVRVGSITAVNGTWSWQPAATLIDGQHSFTITATDVAGNVSTASVDYQFMVDTRPPITQGQVADSIDPTKEWVDNITNDTLPRLSGVGEPNSTVTLYQNGVSVATFAVNSDGSWSWQPPANLSDGEYRFTSTLTDLAGNTSELSTATLVVVDTTPPAAQAIVESMSKDSATFGADNNFTTRDGSAGRLIQGTLSAALGAGDKVQVSVDNGVSWQDATVLPDGRWFIVDSTSHSSDWVIQTRVIDRLQNATYAEQKVSLDVISPDAPQLSWDGKVITVVHPAELQVGDVIILHLDGRKMTIEVTQADIDNGQTKIDWDAEVEGNTKEISAAYIDNNGNASDWNSLTQKAAQIIDENFSGQAAKNIVTGDVFEFAQFTLIADIIRNEGNYISRFGSTNQGGIGQPPQSMALEISGQSSFTMSIKDDQQYNFISFTVGDLNGAETMTATFYDADNNEVYSTVRTGASGRITTVEVEIPYGQVFSSVRLSVGSGTYIWIDDIHFSHLEYATSPDPTPSPSFQDLAEAGAWFGDVTDDMFTVHDVALLNDTAFSLNGADGVDTLQISGGNQTLDLTVLSNKIQSVEIIDITGSGNNTLNLSLGDVLAQGGTNLFIADGNVQMMVKGNTGDVVNLSDLLPGDADAGNWNQSSSATVNGVSYDVWQHSGLEAELLVQNGVQVNLENH